MTAARQLEMAQGGRRNGSTSEVTKEQQTSSNSASLASPLIHKVGYASSEPYKEDLVDMWADINPLQKLKGKHGWRLGKALLFLLVPCLRWMFSYKRSYLQGDIIAGLTIAVMAIPQDLAYAQLAKLPPIHGLYTSFLPPLVYAIFGSSRHIAVGPVAVVSLLLGDLLPRHVSPSRVDDYVRLATATTLWVGIIQLALGLLRLGFLIEFLSHATIVGFMAGAAITIGMSQLKNLLGYKNFTNKTNVQSVIKSLIEYHSQFSWQTFLIGIFFLFYMVASKQIAKRWKRLWLLAALSPLVSVVASTIFCYVTKANSHGVKVVGKVPKGLPPTSHPDLSLTSEAIGPAIVAAFVGLTEAVSIARTFADKNGYAIKGSQEMYAFGLSNIVGSLTSSYVATGSFSRSAVNEASGVNTAFANIIMTVVILFTLLVLTSLFYYLPQTVLAAIIISALFGLIDVQGVKTIWRTDKLDFLCCLGAFVGVLFVSVEIGIAIAVGISLAKVILQAVRPHTAILGRIPDTKVYRSIKQYPEARQEPGMLIVRFDAALFFANSLFMKERIKSYVDSYRQLNPVHDVSPLRFVILDMSPVTSIDVTAALVLKDLCVDLTKKGYRLGLSNPSLAVTYRLQRAQVLDVVGVEWTFVTINDAVWVCQELIRAHGEAVELDERTVRGANPAGEV